jgi:hypothetical protein
LTPGIYAVSATMLQHVYSRVRGDWTIELEKEYQQLRSLESAMLRYQDSPATREMLLREAPEANWIRAWQRYEQLRFARLCHYLRVRDADAAIGHSIFIFRLSQTELTHAIGGTLDEWRQLLQRSIEERHGAGE